MAVLLCLPVLVRLGYLYWYTHGSYVVFTCTGLLTAVTLYLPVWPMVRRNFEFGLWHAHIMMAEEWGGERYAHNLNLLVIVNIQRKQWIYICSIFNFYWISFHFFYKNILFIYSMQFLFKILFCNNF